jgi:DNA repair exonuclease SbcCD ATPase subunit
MYINHLKVKNIRSITEFDMRFDNPAGWHVLIGDNGAGKTTVIRAIALPWWVQRSFGPTSRLEGLA